MEPYRHEHTGIEEISWPRLGELLVALAEKVSGDFRPEIVVGIAKGGVIPGAFLGSAFRVDFLPIKLSSRQDERVISDVPSWFVRPTTLVRGRDVLLVDDICVAGRTLELAREEVGRMGAVHIRTAALATHSGGGRPDYVALATDALIVWPWDREILSRRGQWSMNPEYREEMARLGAAGPGGAAVSEDPDAEPT